MGWQDRRVLLAEIVATSAEVGATRSRTAKLAALTELLRRLAPEEVVPAVAALTGAPRQGRIGVGWRTVYGVEVAPAQDPCIERSEEHTSELQSLMRISYAVFCLKKKKTKTNQTRGTCE